MNQEKNKAKMHRFFASLSSDDVFVTARFYEGTQWARKRNEVKQDIQPALRITVTRRYDWVPCVFDALQV